MVLCELVQDCRQAQGTGQTRAPTGQAGRLHPKYAELPRVSAAALLAVKGAEFF